MPAIADACSVLNTAFRRGRSAVLPARQRRVPRSCYPIGHQSVIGRLVRRGYPRNRQRLSSTLGRDKTNQRGRSLATDRHPGLPGAAALIVAIHFHSHGLISERRR